MRRKVYGKTKQDVRVKLKTLRSDITAGVRAPASYTVQSAVDDWLSGRWERTLTLYRDGVKPLTDKIGARQLRRLTAAEVRTALNALRSSQLGPSLAILSPLRSPSFSRKALRWAAEILDPSRHLADVLAGSEGQFCPASSAEKSIVMPRTIPAG